ncbi:hypothetical protein NP233_g1083 [Leucocoprinus birnbaumii]|uniref:FAD-binding PCMH-type domain-containing protein n=1 Tax=Leucocoprinus birnbaumii TaxID=56174 RepID=A0AAD5W164_9AGAR|nr:hypothetical protein NP233_g1083 [Leucocoprinus birnbaumii]
MKLWGVLILAAYTACAQRCRNIPGSPGYPTTTEWDALDSSVGGRLVQALPSGEVCRLTLCSTADWTSANWRNTVPGAMNQVNWEQDYNSVPPSLCGQFTPAICGQGDVPPFAILAQTAEDIQAGVNFAREHNLRLSIKASGHDYLGRSTAKHSLLIHTQKLQSIEFTDNFLVGGLNKGSAVTVGSGVGLSALYNATKNVGKIFVGGSAATVAPGGGYVQGAGHSALSPLLGLAADNALEFNIVTADGQLRKANEVENSDRVIISVFWALRGGGAGSWGVIVNTTFSTFPTFQAVRSRVLFLATGSLVIGATGAAYARHVFDWDSMNVGQYYYTVGVGSNYTIIVDTIFPNATEAQATRALAPLFTELLLSGAVPISNTTVTATINELLATGDDLCGGYAVLGSRLIPAASYRSSPLAIGDAYRRLADVGSIGILSHLVAGGKVAANAEIDNAVNPGWRTAKTHLIVTNQFTDISTPLQVTATLNKFKNDQLPIFQSIQGSNPAAYSGEADPFEEDFQSVFYGPNYDKLSAIKAKYDPDDLFIVRTGVGSERWDADGLCRV